MVRIILLATTMLALTACGHAPTALSRPRTDSEIAPLQRCDDASECVRVDNGCCDCANGGATAAVNREYEKQFRNSFDCRNVICSQKAGACLYLEPLCHDHRCELGKRPKLFPEK